jgi:hypothetical protein
MLTKFLGTKHSVIILNQKELAYSLQKNQIDAMNGILRSRVNQTWEPHLKSISMIKKKIWVIDDDEIYQIIVTKIIQNKFILDYFFLL